MLEKLMSLMGSDSQNPEGKSVDGGDFVDDLGLLFLGFASPFNIQCDKRVNAIAIQFLLEFEFDSIKNKTLEKIG